LIKRAKAKGGFNTSEIALFFSWGMG